VLKHIHLITVEAAFTVASNLIHTDRREVVEGYGYDNVLDIAIGAAASPDTYYVSTPDGKIAAMGGFQSGGQLWMLCTPAIHDSPLTFARTIKRMVDSRTEKLLWNIVDKRNTTHIRLLRFLGFKFLREVIHGPNNLPFIEFCKIQCVLQNQPPITKEMQQQTLV
jgi:hypothetical protein